jgi:hypothetical protein
MTWSGLQLSFFVAGEQSQPCNTTVLQERNLRVNLRQIFGRKRKDESRSDDAVQFLRPGGDFCAPFQLSVRETHEWKTGGEGDLNPRDPSECTCSPGKSEGES